MPAPGFADLIKRMPTEELARQAAIADAKAGGGGWTRVGDTPSMLGSGLNKAYIAHTPAKEYNVGDLIIFNRTGGGRTIHPIHARRLKSVESLPMGSDDSYVETGRNYEYYPKGTKNPVGDGWMELQDIVGKVVRGYKGT